MSVAASAWAWLQDIPTGPKFVLLDLADRHNGQSGKCIAKVATIAARTGQSARSVQRHLGDLARLGLIALQSRHKRAHKFVLRLSEAAADTTRREASALASVRDTVSPIEGGFATQCHPEPEGRDSTGRKEESVAGATHARELLPDLSKSSPPQQARQSRTEDIAPTIEVAIGVSIEPSPVVEAVQAAPVVGPVEEVAAGPIMVRGGVEAGKQARGSGRKAPLADDWFPNPAQIALALRMGAIDVNDEVRRYRIRHERDDTRADAAGWTRWWESWCDKIGRYGKAPARRSGDLSWLGGAMARYADPGGPIIEGAVA